MQALAVAGIVRHSADACIGCQYCVLKCPYDVPKYNARLGIVRKCDMCHSRLAAGSGLALDDLDQRLVHVGRHVGGIATDVEMGAFLEPGVDLEGASPDAVLHVDLAAAVTREDDVDEREPALALMRLPFGLVEKVGAEIAISEDEP